MWPAEVESHEDEIVADLGLEVFPVEDGSIL
jgi:hypothetical protein